MKMGVVKIIVSDSSTREDFLATMVRVRGSLAAIGAFTERMCQFEETDPDFDEKFDLAMTSLMAMLHAVYPSRQA